MPSKQQAKAKQEMSEEELSEGSYDPEIDDYDEEVDGEGSDDIREVNKSNLLNYESDESEDDDDSDDFGNHL